MPSIETLLIFTAAALLMNISPGPSNFYVMSRSLAQGFSAGMVAAAGLAAGSLVHVLLAVVGVSMLLYYSPMGFTLMKLAGAGYLVYLGVGYLMRARSGEAEQSEPLREDSERKTSRRIFLESVVVEVLNPKTALFFMAFLPQFVDPSRGMPGTQLLVLGVIVTLTALPCDGLVAWLAHATGRRAARSPLLQRLRSAAAGSVLISIGAYVALSERPS